MKEPISIKIIHEDMPMEERGHRAELSKIGTDLADELLQKCPEVTIALTLIHTPRPEGKRGPHDEVHSAIATTDPTTVDDFKEFLKKAIPSMTYLLRKMEESPGLFDGDYRAEPK